MNNLPNIRPFRPDDLDEIKRITVAAFAPVSIDRNIEQQFGELNQKDWTWCKSRQIDADCQANPAGVLVAETGGNVVGYVTCRIDRKTLVGWIPNLAVQVTLHRQGVGKILLEAALEYFRTEGMKHARIETLQQNPIGQFLYPNLGFQEIGRQIYYMMAL